MPNNSPMFSLSRDDEIDEMLDSWDIIQCGICGADISMLDARMVSDGYGDEKFVCSEHSDTIE